ncbi:MAG: hypothetical protein WC205_15190 [Opitutaceae bacterium]|jgi:hypothetical protein
MNPIVNPCSITVKTCRTILKNAKTELEKAEFSFYMKFKKTKIPLKWLKTLYDTTSKERYRVSRAESLLKSTLIQKSHNNYFRKPIYIKNPKQWPASVACLDIETKREIMHRRPTQKDIKCIGIKIFKLANNYYIEQEKHTLTPTNFSDTQKILRKAKIIVGWNVTGFDYFILKNEMGINEFYKKTVDPFFSLIVKTGGREGNGLQNTSKRLLKFGKLKSS